MVLSDGVIIAIVVAVPPLISVPFMAWLTSRNLRKDKEKDAEIRKEERVESEARQDEVAAKAAEAAQRLIDRQDTLAHQADAAAKLLAENTAKVAESAKITSDKLDVIHLLVNSNMTAAMQAEFDATTRELAMMHEVVELKKATGQQPSVLALAAIDATNARLIELRATLDDRLRQAKVVDKQQQIQRESPT